MKRIVFVAFLVIVCNARAQHRLPIPVLDDLLIELTPIPLRYASAEQAATHLEKVFGKSNEMKVAWDDGTNTIFISARKEQLQKARVILNKLDERPNYDLCVVKLTFADVVQCAKQLEALYRGKDIRITANQLDNSVILSGAPSHVIAARNSLLLWDAQAGTKKR
jgi:Bacterial type II/III secretion system short domain